MGSREVLLHFILSSVAIIVSARWPHYQLPCSIVCNRFFTEVCRLNHSRYRTTWPSSSPTSRTSVKTRYIACQAHPLDEKQPKTATCGITSSLSNPETSPWCGSNVNLVPQPDLQYERPISPASTILMTTTDIDSHYFCFCVRQAQFCNLRGVDRTIALLRRSLTFDYN